MCKVKERMEIIMYKELKRIYDNNRLDVFVMAVANLLDKGYDKVIKITDKDISELHMPERSIMTTEFAQYLTRLTRDIARNCDSVVEIIQFCAKEKVFDIKNYGREK